MDLKVVQFMCFGLFLISGETAVKAEDITVDTSHSFSSENYPNDYPSNYNKTWCFYTNGTSRLLLSFDEINTENYFDFITVYEGTAASVNTQLLRWSGNNVDEQPRVLSSGSNLCLRFETDSLVNYPGFSGQVEVVDSSHSDSCTGFDCENGVCLGRYDLCNGFVNCGNGKDEICTENVRVDSNMQEFKSIHYDDGSYVSNHHYTWIFEGNDMMQLEIEFTNVDIEKESSFDLILVGDGPDTSLNRLLTWHGGVNASTTVRVRSSGSSMWVHFQTDESDHGRGFSANVSNVDRQADIPCDNFDCGNGVCIPNNKRCDGFIQCGNRNDEDIQCPSRCDDGDIPCSDGISCFSDEDRCNTSPVCLKDDDEYGCQNEIDVDNRYTRQYHNFNQTIKFKSTMPGTHLLMNLFFLRTESSNVEASLNVSENELTSSPILQRNGLVDDYVITLRSSGNVLWLSFTVTGILVISVNVVNEAPIQPTCPEDIPVTGEDESVTWNSPLCRDREDGNFTSTCSPSSGENFPNGESMVTCTCIDSLDSSSSCDFTVFRPIPPVIETQLVPLLIGLAVVGILIVLIVAFVLTSRFGNKRRRILRNDDDDSSEHIHLRGRAGSAHGIDNPHIQEDPEHIQPAYQDDRPTQSPLYHSIGEGPGVLPDTPGRKAAVDANSASYSSTVYNEGSNPDDDKSASYSSTLYNDSSRPKPPERSARDIEQSPYYSRQVSSPSQNQHNV